MRCGSLDVRRPSAAPIVEDMATSPPDRARQVASQPEALSEHALDAAYAQLAVEFDSEVEDLGEALRESEANISAHDDSSAERETAYLLRSPENARRLMEAVARDKAGGE